METNLNLKRSLHAFLILIISISCALSLYILFFSMNKGFNLSDESYYILSITQASHRLFELSHFSYELGSLYNLVNHNLITLRESGVVILLIMSCIFSLALQSYMQIKKPYSYLILTSITLSGLNFYYNLLLTPSYNWLNLIAILMTSTSLFFYFKPSGFKTLENTQSIGFAILAGIGGGLAFIDKPPSAILLAIFVVLWVAYHHHNYPGFFKIGRFILLAAASALIFISAHAYIYFQGLENYIHDILRALNAAKIMGINHNLPMVFSKSVSDLSLFLFHPHLLKLDLVLLFFLTCYLIARKALPFLDHDKLYKYFVHTMLLFPISIFLAETIVMFINDIYPPFNFLPHLNDQLINLRPGVNLMVYFFILFLSCICIYKYTKNKNQHSTSKETNSFIIALFLLGMSFAYAFGTNNNFVYQLGGAAIFIISAAFILLENIKPTQIKHFYQSIFILINALFIVLSSYHVYLHPYRLGGNMNQQTETINFLNTNYELCVDKNTAHYVNHLKTAAIKSNWKPRTLLINLTPDSNGALVIMDAMIPGAAWLAGGTLEVIDGHSYIKHILNQIPHELLKNAWVLTKNNDNKINNKLILKEYHFPENYIAVAKLKHPEREEYQTLWKPL